jgi:hypothetical protein
MKKNEKKSQLLTKKIRIFYQYAIIFIFFLGYSSCENKNKIENCTVKDEFSKKPVSEVKILAILINNTAKQMSDTFKTFSDINGNFQIKGLPGMMYKISFFKIGYYDAGNETIEIPKEKDTKKGKEFNIYFKLPDSDTEYNILDTNLQTIIHKIKVIDYNKIGFANHGFGDVYYYFANSDLTKFQAVEQPKFLLQIDNSKYDALCTTTSISKLIKQGDTYEIAKRNHNSFEMSYLTKLYSYIENGNAKTLYKFPSLESGFYLFGTKLECTGEKEIFQVK